MQSAAIHAWSQEPIRCRSHDHGHESIAIIDAIMSVKHELQALPDFSSAQIMLTEDMHMQARTTLPSSNSPVADIGTISRPADAQVSVQSLTTAANGQCQLVHLHQHFCPVLQTFGKDERSQAHLRAANTLQICTPAAAGCEGRAHSCLGRCAGRDVAWTCIWGFQMVFSTSTHHHNTAEYDRQ